jgi:hypothetical protein
MKGFVPVRASLIANAPVLAAMDCVAHVPRRSNAFCRGTSHRSFAVVRPKLRIDRRIESHSEPAGRSRPFPSERRTLQAFLISTFPPLRAVVIARAASYAGCFIWASS